MTELLPWIIVLLIIALAGGYALGRKAAVRASPAASMPPARRAAGPAATPAPIQGTRPAAAPAVAAAHSHAEAPAQAAAPAGAALPAAVLSRVATWGYQLQNLNLAKAAASPFDLLVIDYSKDGSDEAALKPAEIERLQRKPDGGRRIVIAYVSVGEAESYRFYWQRGWKRDKPAWLLGENPDWKENYAVCFWEPGWQALMCGGPEAYLDRIIAQGFDGIYLDKCDVTDDLREHFKSAARSRRDLDGDMVAFVERLSSYAKARRPGFLVIMQNAEVLLERPTLRAAIDAVAKEELLYGLDAPERPNSKGEIAESRDLLDLLKDDGKPVLMVEYLDSAPKIRSAIEEARRLGYILYVAPKDRELDRLNAAPAAV
jgi:cysteinyl-tRNA synthetase